MGEGLGTGQVLLGSVQKAPRDHMKAITFACRKTLPLEPEAIANQRLDLAKWPDFRGYPSGKEASEVNGLNEG